MNNDEKRKLALAEIILIILAAGGLFTVMWLAWLRPARINSFESCSRAGNPIQESYPEVCVTPDGKRFVNKTQATE